MIIINPYQFGAAPSSLLTGLTASYSLNGNALKNVGSNDGTATNVTWGSGVWGDSGLFNGTGYISVPNNSDFNLGSGDWSFSVLVRRSVFNSRQLILGTCNAGGTNSDVGFVLEFNSDDNIRFLYYLTNTSTLSIIDFSYEIIDTNWHNLIVCRGGNRLKLYFDGGLVYNGIVFNPGDTIKFPSSTFSIGRAGDLNSLLYNGSIDEFNLWNGREITLSEVTELQERYYPFITPVSLEPETTAYLAELTTTPSTFNQAIFNQFFKNLKGTGVTGTYDNLSEIDRLWLFANEFQQAARVSMVNPSSTTVSEINSPTWTQLRGYNGDTISKYINSNFTPSTDGVNYLQNSASLFVYSLTNSTQNYYEYGAVSSGSPNDNKSFLALRSGAGNAAYPINVNTGIGSPLVSVSDSLGLYHSKLSGTAIELWKNGSLISSDTITPEPLNNIPLFLLCINYYGTALLLSDRQLAIAGTGSGNIDHASFNQAIQNLATSLGFKV